MKPVSKDLVFQNYLVLLNHYCKKIGTVPSSQYYIKNVEENLTLSEIYKIEKRLSNRNKQTVH